MAREDDSRAARARRGGLTLESHRDGDSHVLELRGELDIAGCPALESELERVEASDAATIVCDLSGLEFIDSSGIRQLVMAADRSSSSDRLRIVPGGEQVQRVFAITDLESRLPFVDT